MNSKKVIKDNIRALNDENGKRFEDPTQIVKILNDQFKSVFEIYNGENPEFIREKRVYNWGNLTDVNEEIILEKKMNSYNFRHNNFRVP